MFILKSFIHSLEKFFRKSYNKVLSLKVFLRVKAIKHRLYGGAVSAYPLGRDFFMSENRLAVISIIVEKREQSANINALLSEFGDNIIGRMGLPYKQKGVSVISVILDAPTELINKLTGKIGMLDGVTAKTLMSRI